jgi:alkyl hydroperoxide reductase subunit AhpC
MGPDTSSSLSNRAARPKFSPNGRAGVRAAAVIALLGMIGILGVAAVRGGVAAAGAPQPGPAPQIGQPAPDFTATDSKGNPVRLQEYRGKTVVLEWTNADCPFTRKHYTSGNMQSLQGLAQSNGVVWLTVISSAPGKQGYVNGPNADALTQSRKAVPSAVLLDPSGAVGHLYAAKTTPHMFVIDKNGTLQYMGGLDSLATTDEADIARAEPYLKEAMLAVVQGNPVAHPVSKPYGCSIKY